MNLYGNIPCFTFSPATVPPKLSPNPGGWTKEQIISSIDCWIAHEEGNTRSSSKTSLLYNRLMFHLNGNGKEWKGGTNPVIPSKNFRTLELSHTFRIIKWVITFGCQIELPKPFQALQTLHSCASCMALVTLSSTRWMSVKVILQNLILPENLLVPICTVQGDMNPIVFNRPETASFPKRG